MIQIRRSIFETNSSSVHSLTMCSGQQMQDWKDGKLFYKKYGREDWIPATPELLAMDPEYRMEGEEVYTYMGDDGQHTMYVDMVKREFAMNSTSADRRPLLPTIDKMFTEVKKIANEKSH